MTHRNLPHLTAGHGFTPTFHPDRLDAPLHWRKPRRIGVSFMGDLFHDAITLNQIASVLDVVWQSHEARLGHTFLMLTKRPERMRALDFECPPSLWPGITVCNQAEADHHIPIILATPAAKRWVSLEPMLGAVDLSPWLYDEAFDPVDGPLGPTGPGPWLDWVVLGGETGPGARPMQPEWALDVYHQCKAAGVAFWFKEGGREFWRVWNGGIPDLAELKEMVVTHELPVSR